MKVSVKSRLDNLLNMKKKIQTANLSQATATEFSRILRQEVRNRVSPASSGRLGQNIRAIKRGRYGYGVYAPYYVWYVNYGRRPGRPPGANNLKIVDWAGRAGLSPRYVSQSIGNFGTKPKLFYESARARFRRKKKQIYKDEMYKLKKR